MREQQAVIFLRAGSSSKATTPTTSVNKRNQTTSSSFASSVVRTCNVCHHHYLLCFSRAGLDTTIHQPSLAASSTTLLVRLPGPQSRACHTVPDRPSPRFDLHLITSHHTIRLVVHRCTDSHLRAADKMRRPSLVSPLSLSPPMPLKVDLPTSTATTTGLESPSDTASDSPTLCTPFSPLLIPDADSPAESSHGARRRCSDIHDTKLPRFSLVPPFKPISYPYTSSALSTRLRSTLRPRRRSSFYRLAQKRFLHIACTLAIPLLFLCILGEHATHRHRAALGRQADSASMPRMFHAGAAVDLGQMREAYERKRRRDIVVARTPPGYAKRSLTLLERNVDGVQAGGMGGVDWSLEEEVQLRDEVQDVWPQWWGNVDVVGPGPFDYTSTLQGKRRILFLTGESDLCRCGA